MHLLPMYLLLMHLLLMLPHLTREHRRSATSYQAILLKDHIFQWLECLQANDHTATIGQSFIWRRAFARWRIACISLHRNILRDTFIHFWGIIVSICDDLGIFRGSTGIIGTTSTLTTTRLMVTSTIGASTDISISRNVLQTIIVPASNKTINDQSWKAAVLIAFISRHEIKNYLKVWAGLAIKVKSRNFVD